MPKFLTSIFKAIFAWLTKGTNDEYLIIKPSAKIEHMVEEIPGRLRGEDIPNFGSDQERMLKLAVEKFSEDSLRIKWLQAMYKLRFGTKMGWIGETNVAHIKDSRFVNKRRKSAVTDPDEILKLIREMDQDIHSIFNEKSSRIGLSAVKPTKLTLVK